VNPPSPTLLCSVYSGCQAKPGRSSGMKGAHHVIACLTCSLDRSADVAGGEVKVRAATQVNPLASLHRMGAVNLPEMSKPSADGEAAGACSRPAPRG
jgi:hypothetical protein